MDSDYHEMRRCEDVGCWKAVLVLAGSIVEALLVDHLIAGGQTSPDPRKMTLDKLIATARESETLSQRTVDLSSVIKSYRNLIHPGRTTRMNEVVDSESANVAISVLAMIIREVAAKRQRAFGLTAEQIVTKFGSDATALAIADHLLKDVSEDELRRLLLEVLPARYFAELQEEGARSEGLEGHAKLFRTAVDAAPEELKRESTARFVTVLREESGLRVRVNEEEFFRGRDLEYADADDRRLVIDHLLARIKDEDNPVRVMASAGGIGAYLQVNQAVAFVDAFMWHVAVSFPPTSEIAKDRLEQESSVTSVELDDAIAKRLSAWENHYVARPEIGDVAAGIKNAYELAAGIPF